MTGYAELLLRLDRAAIAPVPSVLVVRDAAAAIRALEAELATASDFAVREEHINSGLLADLEAAKAEAAMLREEVTLRDAREQSAVAAAIERAAKACDAEASETAALERKPGAAKTNIAMMQFGAVACAEAIRAILPSVVAAEARRVEQDDEKYHELIMAVAQKFPNETRHQTALRYIQQHEAAALSGVPGAAKG